MIRVLIAEDEPPTLRRIARMVEQADPLFQIAATAADGEEALRRMEDAPCDVLLTDIRMPVMDGLELMDIVRERYPSCQIVILSGYKDFSYVAHAVRASAVDYLLKPVTPEEMAALSKRLIATFNRQKRERLTRSLSVSINRTELGMQQADGAEFPDARLSVCLFSIGPVPLREEAGLLMGDGDTPPVPLEALVRAVVPHYSGFTWAFAGSTQAEQILIFERTEGPVRDIAVRLHGALADRHDVPVSCAWASESVGLPGIGRTIARLRRRLLLSVQVDRGIFVEVSPDESDRGQIGHYQDHQQAKMLSEQLLLRSAALGRAFWRELSGRMERERWTRDRIHSLFISAFAYLEAERGATEELVQARTLVTDVLSTSSSFDELAEGFDGLATLFGEEGQADALLRQTVASRVEQYLTTHYAEHINNQTLGTEFGYVPSYISLLFRKAYGVSPAEYLMRLRLDRAKQLMRESPGLLMRDIAERVGFKSPHHFSRMFRKYEGIWPTDYAMGEVAGE